MAEVSSSEAPRPPWKEIGRTRTTSDSAEDDAFELPGFAVAKKWQGTAADKKDMVQLGRVQELRVCFE